MTKPKLTIGMAHNHDYSGAYFTVRQIRAGQRRLKEIELIVVDTSPETQHGVDLKGFFLGACSKGTAGSQYIPMTDKPGTSQPRNRVFQEAKGDIVLCVDCHVTIEPFALDRLIEYYEKNPDCNNLIQGPMTGDHDEVYATHFGDVWRDEMWGIWQTDPRGTCEHEDLPVIDRVEHTIKMPPFEIPAMGLGLFGCQKKDWLGFNEHFRGFGGEEWYIHEKYRKAGRKCLCLPWLRWGHRFGRPEGVGYSINQEHKVRNYMLGHTELDIPLDRLYKHFVEERQMTNEKWNWQLADLEKNIPAYSIPQLLRRQDQKNPEQNPLAPANPIDRSRPQPPADATIDEIFEWCKTVPRDLEQHLDTFKLWSSKCKHVTEFSERRESTVGLLAGRPERLISFNLENDLLLHIEGAIHKALLKENKELDAAGKPYTLLTTNVAESLRIPKIEPTDGLFVDTRHNGKHLALELALHGPMVKRFIMVHDTVGFGERGDDGAEGLNHALRDWLMDNEEWFVAFHDPKQYGMTVLSKHLDDWPAEEIVPWPPGHGPGTELKKIIKLMGINPEPGCSCNARILQMDKWGVSESRANFDTIVAWMRDGEEKWGWHDKWAAGAKLLMKDIKLAFKVDPKDPFPILITTSIQRAEKEEKKREIRAKKARKAGAK